MNRAVKLTERLAAMPDHGAGEGRPGFCRNFDGTGNEELVVGHWENVQRRTPNVQCRMSRQQKSCSYFSLFLMKLMSPLRSRRASAMDEASSVWASRRRSSSKSCLETKALFSAS